MLPGAEQLISESLGAALISAEKNIGSRIWAATRGRRHRERERTASAVAARMSKAQGIVRDLRLTKILAALPSGLTISQLQVGLEGPVLEGLVCELFSARVADVPADRIDKIRSNFELSSIVAFPDIDHEAAKEFGAEIFNELDSVVQAMVKTLEGIESREAIREVAIMRLVIATLEAIERHNEQLLTQIAGNPQGYLSWQTDYRQQVVHAHGYIEPPDFERKRKVPIDTLFIKPIITLRGNASYENRELPDFMSAFERRSEYPRSMQLPSALDRAVLLGDPGAGKSTCASVIAYRTALQRDGLLPFIVILRLYASQAENELSIVKYIEKRIETHYQCAPPPGAVESVLLSGQALVIFDGLDELVDTYQRREITNRVELFASRYPLARVLVTSRKVGYSQAQLDESIFWDYEMSGFQDDQIESYVSRWFRHVEMLAPEESERIGRAFIAESESVSDLRTNPLMLSLLCIIYRGQDYLPRNRPDVYERCATLLFDRWDSSRKIHVDLTARAYVDSAMKHLAYWIFSYDSDDDGVTETQLVIEATRYFRPAFDTDDEAVWAAREFVEFCRGRAWVFSDVGTTADGEPLFKFTHRTFLEYFTAFELTRRSNGPEELGEVLLPHVSRQEWDVVAQLAVQITNRNSLSGADRTLTYLLNADLDRRQRWNVMLFAARCAGFLHLAPSLIRRIVQNALDVGLSQSLKTGSADGFSEFANPVDQSRFPVEFANVLGTLLGVIPELRNSVADQLAIELERRVDSSSESTRRSSRELLYVLPEWIADKESTEILVFWLGWRSALMRRCVLHGDHPDPRDWRAGLALRIISLVEYVTDSPLRVKMPLNRLWFGVRADLAGLTYQAPIVDAISQRWLSVDPANADLAGTPPDGSSLGRRGEGDGSVVNELKEFAAYLSSLGEPPWASSEVHKFAWRGSGYLPNVIPAAIKGDALWALIVLGLLAFEAGNLSGDSGFLRGIVTSRQRKSGFSIENSDPWNSLSSRQQEILRRWMHREVSFFAPLGPESRR